MDKSIKSQVKSDFSHVGVSSRKSQFSLPLPHYWELIAGVEVREFCRDGNLHAPWTVPSSSRNQTSRYFVQGSNLNFPAPDWRILGLNVQSRPGREEGDGDRFMI